MDRLVGVRYVRCQGPLLARLISDASWAIIRIEQYQSANGVQDYFGGYVAVDAAGNVLEKSDCYGVYEGEADGFPGGYGDKCIPASREAFKEAWGRPYAKRSLRRRFLASLNGASDSDGDPSEQDPTLAANPPSSTGDGDDMVQSAN
jgi:hypothetical protein